MMTTTARSILILVILLQTWKRTLKQFPLLLLLLLVTQPLPRNRSMAEGHGAPEAGQLPRVWTRGSKETESRQRASGAKKSVAGQCRMR